MRTEAFCLFLNFVSKPASDLLLREFLPVPSVWNEFVGEALKSPPPPADIMYTRYKFSKVLSNIMLQRVGLFAF